MEQSGQYLQKRSQRIEQCSQLRGNSETGYPPKVVKLGCSVPQQFVSNLIKIDSEIVVHVGDIRNPTKFWIIIKEGLLDVADLMYYIQEVYFDENQCEELQIFEEDVTEGIFCVAMYEGEYNRGLVQKINTKIHQVEVLFIDYGTVALVDSRKLYFLLNKFSYLPQQAIKAQLDDIRPHGTKWSVEAIQQFSSLVGEFKELRAKIVNIDHSNKVLKVELMDMLTGESIGKALVKTKFAVGEHYEPQVEFQYPPGVSKPGDLIGQQFISTATKKHDEVEFCVGEIVNPSQFWLILQPGFDDLLVLLNEMHYTYMEELTKLKIPEQELKVDMHCVSKYEGEYSRARITKIMLEDHQVEILSIDFGTVSIVNSTELFFLLNKFTYLPGQAIEAKLGGIRAFESDWSTEATQKFTYLVSNYKIVTAKLLNIDWDKKVLEVNLVDKKNGVCINDALVEDNLALNLIPQNENFLDIVKLDNDIPHQLDVTNIKEKDEVLLHISKVINPSKFWVILNNDFDGLQMLTKEFQVTYGGEFPKTRIPYNQLKEGMPCVVLHDSRYCRALITKVRMEGDQVDLFCFDYGNLCSKESTELYFLYERFARLPQQAIRATLIGIVPREPSRRWSSEAIERFSEMVKDKSLRAKLSYLDQEKQILKVLMYTDCSSDNRKLINDALIQEQWASVSL